jgi:hypothetical protein
LEWYWKERRLRKGEGDVGHEGVHIGFARSSLRVNAAYKRIRKYHSKNRPVQPLSARIWTPLNRHWVTSLRQNSSLQSQVNSWFVGLPDNGNRLIGKSRTRTSLFRLVR